MVEFRGEKQTKDTHIGITILFHIYSGLMRIKGGRSEERQSRRERRQRSEQVFPKSAERERDKMVATPYDSFLIISKTINETM